MLFGRRHALLGTSCGNCADMLVNCSVLHDADGLEGVKVMEINTNWKQYPEVCINGAEKLKPELQKMLDKYREKSLKKHEKIVEKYQKVLGEYGTEEEIQEAWGYDWISKAKRDRLLKIVREDLNAPVPEDAIVQFLERTLRDLEDFKQYETK